LSRPKLLDSGIVDVEFGTDVRIIRPVNLYGCKLGDGVFVGPFVEIQRGAVIGKGSRVQSHTFICDLVEIGERCFISHGVVFINDTFQSGGPSGRQRDKWKPTFVGSDVSIGSNATILPVRICDRAVIGAGAVVTRDVTRAGVYAGNPARLIRRF